MDTRSLSGTSDASVFWNYECTSDTETILFSFSGATESQLTNDPYFGELEAACSKSPKDG